MRSAKDRRATKPATGSANTAVILSAATGTTVLPTRRSRPTNTSGISSVGRPVTGLLQSDSDKALLEAVFHTERGDFGGAIFADSHRPFFRTLSGGYLINTGSVGNSMGIPNAHAVLLECTPGEEKKPLFCTVICVPYDNEAAADIARRDPGLPRKEAYIREVLTGIYSR